MRRMKSGDQTFKESRSHWNLYLEQILSQLGAASYGTLGARVHGGTNMLLVHDART